MIDEPAHIGVIVFGYSQADKTSDRHIKMCKAVKDNQIALATKGSTVKFRLPTAQP